MITRCEIIEQVEDTPIYCNNLPTFSLDPDWNDVFGFGDHFGGTVTVTCKQLGQIGASGQITRSRKGRGIDLVTTNGFEIGVYTSTALGVFYRPYNALFISYLETYKIHEKSVKCVDVNEKNTLTASVGADNPTCAVIWRREDSKVLFTLSGHCGDIYKCKWFPSGLVLLTCGGDMMIKIWCAQTGRCGATLMGHTAAVTDVAIIDIGRNIISVSKDGTARLWLCGTASCIAILYKGESAINCCAVSSAPIKTTEPRPSCFGCWDEPAREKEEDTTLLMFGCEDGTIACVGVQTKKVLYTTRLASAVNCACSIKHGLFAFGCQDGSLHTVNVIKDKYESWHETYSPALCMVGYNQEGFIVGRADGSACHQPAYKKCISRAQLSGPNADPVYDISYNMKHVYTAARDSLIRQYYTHPYIPTVYAKELDI